MMKFILLTALSYQPLYHYDGSPNVSFAQITLESTNSVKVTAKPLDDVDQLSAEIANELDRQLKAMHAELPQQSGEQQLLVNQIR
ncbi:MULTISPECIES: hypothetical protein [Shewanella]|uniref:Uncharacterized protein n=1 Tax=Shewanella marisflavi TaxID=260364 RepID=A0AAC9TZT5_9GAMM|nr:hypothetical protein [Shewanella marisflavi]ASJ96738.1 hypothetical protein CFF01_09170 [Shewanella marisflavi]MCL1041191.1 hypothetical protein [Shewanella marisflavi]